MLKVNKRVTDAATGLAARLKGALCLALLMCAAGVTAANTQQQFSASVLMRYDQPAARDFARASDTVEFSLQAVPRLKPEHQEQKTTFALLRDVGMRLARELRQKTAAEDPDGCVLLLGRKTGEGRPTLWAGVHAGYGAVFDERSVIYRGRNGTDWEQPACAYLKTGLKF
jgi:hypothetical protein